MISRNFPPFLLIFLSLSQRKCCWWGVSPTKELGSPFLPLPFPPSRRNFFSCHFSWEAKEEGGRKAPVRGRRRRNPIWESFASSSLSSFLFSPSGELSSFPLLSLSSSFVLYPLVLLRAEVHKTFLEKSFTSGVCI